MASYNSSVGLGQAKLLPVTGGFALPFTVYLLWLSARCVWIRNSSDAFSGGARAAKKTEQSNGYNDLQVATRAHANFVENVPLALVLAGTAELNGANRTALSVVLGGLFILRVLHAELGLFRPGSMSVGRPLGYFGTCALLGGLAWYNACLVGDYWGP
ncbi:hypothetical protein M406DRAFT_342457 [Cryphonectria parasitica EP155]|uniref:MAPEG family protein n=1 Tax=Cryphonectria parasitica (strain ATCC 38755 / EP155) TaxID=660469 RepID=A0A9P4XVK9_CRYP1|nr:uncharacterized protein M406DRAFT_342457 [Cryphonectria parasitica EP155]KAF3761723.1 hypothetical protein M406DRAFT_342457 [Cryphonectria parasitica EP155]